MKKVLIYKKDNILKVDELLNILRSKDIDVRIVEDDENNQSLGYLFKLKDFKGNKNLTNPSLDNPIMVLGGFEGDSLDVLLKQLRDLQIATNAIKAMVTMNNINWTMAYLQNHIVEEYQQMNNK